jgi:alpha-glucosidase
MHKHFISKIVVLINLLVVIFFTTQFASSRDSLKVESPNGELVFNFRIKNDGIEKSCMIYNITYKNKQVIFPSRFGINISPKELNVDTWTNNISVVDTSKRSYNEAWVPIYGERNKILDKFNELTITVKSTNIYAKGNLLIIVRAYNEGIAFCYKFLDGINGGGHLHVASELTEFTLPQNTLAYYTKFAQTEYHLLPLHNWPSESERPLTLVLPNKLYACLTEAEVVNYCRTKFTLDTTKSNTIKCSMYGPVDFVAPFKTPWRVIMIAETPGKLLENDYLILDLNPSCKLKNTSWIKPGKVMREMTLSTDGAKRLVDFAVQRNLQYIHFDAGWYGNEHDINSDATTVTVDPKRNPKGDLNLQEAIKYAKSKGIGVILYVNILALAHQLDKILPLYKSWGVDGIKFGFVQVGSHFWTNWLHEAVNKCAEYKVMVDIHDEYRPTGFSRTYPNLMTQEGVRGNEEMPSAAANTILPFTRFIAGAADYTFCYYYRKEFGHPKRHIRTTPAHQLALPVVYYSPWQFLYWYDKPKDYEGEPELQFWDEVPTTWDNTRVINGEIGKCITIARQSGDDWFIGSITNEEARVLEVPLSFLGEDKKYEAVIYSDDPSVNTRTHVTVNKLEVNNKTILKIKLKSSGGEAIHIKALDCLK